MFSFAAQKKINDLRPHLRRLRDLTTPNLPSEYEDRSDDRLNRAIPTLLCPWEAGRPSVDETTICLTSDLADRGVGLLLNQPTRFEQVVLGYWTCSDQMPEPMFLLGDVRRNQPIGGGFWVLGVELTQLASNEYRYELRQLRVAAARLLPPAEPSLWPEK